MKRILFIISILISFTAYSQTTGFFRYDTVTFQKVGANSEFNLLNSTRTVTGGVLTNLGNGRTRFVLPSGGSNVSLGTGYKIAVDGTNNVKSILPYNGLTGDSATSGQVGVRLGGTLNQNTTIDSGGFFLNFNLSRLGITNSAPNAKLHIVTDAIGVTQLDNKGILLQNTTDATTGLNQTSPPLVFRGAGWVNPGSVNADVMGKIDVVGTKGSNPLATMQFSFMNEFYGAYELGATLALSSALEATSANVGNNRGATFTVGAINGATLWRSSTAGNTSFGASNNMGAAAFTGTGNIVVGSGLTASGLTSAFNNTMVGSGMGFVTTASLNTAVGVSALNALTTGTQNTAVGMNALLANTTGIKNTAFGAAALEENTTGSYNSFNGQDAGLHNSTGIENSGLGYLGGSQNRTGGGNVSVGSSSARGLVNANEVISIGHNSNYLQWSGAAIPEDTLRNSIAIGTHSFNTANNQLMLGSDSVFSAYMYGIAAGAGTHAVRYNPTTKQLFYGDTSASGGGSGVTTMAAIGSTPNANGATISGSTLNLEPASGSFGGVVTTGAQTFAGVKTFSSFPVFSSGTSGRVPFFTTGGAVTDDDGMQFNATSNTFTVTGPAASLTNGPKHEFKLDSDPDPIISWFAYDHDNVQLDFDARFNGSNYTSSHAGSNFAWYKTGNELIAAYNAGTAKGSTFSFNFTGGLRLSNTGLVGIGTAPSEKLHVAGSVRFSGALMPNNAAGTSGQILQSAGAGAPPTWVAQPVSGEYTPTLGSITNIATTTPELVNYMRVGDRVHVEGRFSCTLTNTAGVFSTVSISLPVASAMTLATDLSGLATIRNPASHSAGFITVNTTTDVAEVSFYSAAGGTDVHFSFMYKIK